MVGPVCCWSPLTSTRCDPDRLVSVHPCRFSAASTRAALRDRRARAAAGCAGGVGPGSGAGVRRTAPCERRRPGRLRGHQLRADRRRGRRVLAVPRAGPPGHAAHVPRPVRDAGRPGQVLSRRAPARRGGHRRGLPRVPDHRPAAAALPVGRADQAGARAACRAAGTVRGDPSRPGGRLLARRGRSGPRGQPPRRGARQGAHHRHGPGRHRVHAVPLGRPRVGQPGDQPGARPGVKDAGIQGCAVRLEPVR